MRKAHKTNLEAWFPLACPCHVGALALAFVLGSQLFCRAHGHVIDGIRGVHRNSNAPAALQDAAQ